MMSDSRDVRSIVIWLYTLCFMVLCMVLIGGITRLTDSGLSMVDWRPIMGAVPPLNLEEWTQAFNQYKAYPEYKLINEGMSLSQFKWIFFWEWFHRLFGRLVGLVFFFPYVYFLMRKKVPQGFNKKFIVAFILGGSQGLMGWYMVKSGLVNEPDVSHYRLAAHLSLAFLIISYLYWLVLELKNLSLKKVNSVFKNKVVIVFGFVLIVQIIFGAFVAGLDAGLTHNTFPKMGRSWIPNTVYEFSSLDIYLHNKVVVQFFHRTMGWILFLTGLFLFITRNKVSDFLQRKSVTLVFIILCLQFILGVATLVMYVPISIAALHQIMGCILLLSFIRLLFYSTYQKEIQV